MRLRHVSLWMTLATITVGAQGAIDPAERWARAAAGYQFAFPRDHGGHPEYRTEWWYYTGNLRSTGGRWYGYQVTFFRAGIEPEPANPSRWAVRDLFMAHLAITDVARGRHVWAERLNRAAVGWAGVVSGTLDVWNEDWRARLDGEQYVLEASDPAAQIGVSLRLSPQKPPVLHGALGFTPKGIEPRNVSYYYSLTRLHTQGTLSVGGEAVPLVGLSWMDHDFGTWALEETLAGWDWFAIQLDDGTDLMVSRMRRRDGTLEPRASGATIVDAAGRNVTIAAEAMTIAPRRQWRSSVSGASYPIAWTVEIPQLELVLDVRATVDGQELNTERSTGVVYWEGAIAVSGTRRGHPVSGRGYLEMTGYAGRPMADVLH